MRMSPRMIIRGLLVSAWSGAWRDGLEPWLGRRGVLGVPGGAKRVHDQEDDEARQGDVAGDGVELLPVDDAAVVGDPAAEVAGQRVSEDDADAEDDEVEDVLGAGAHV